MLSRQEWSGAEYEDVNWLPWHEEATQHLEMMRLADSLQILFLFQILGSFCSLGWKNL